MEFQSPFRNVDHGELIRVCAMKVALVPLVLVLPLVASAFRLRAKVKRHSLEPTHCKNKGKAWTKQFCGLPSSNVSKSKVIDFSHVQASPICSQLNQDRYLDAIFKAIGTTNTYFVEFGSRRPEVLNSAHFRLNCGWKGLLLDGAPGHSPNGGCPSCAGQDLLQAADDAPVRLRQAFMTAENINDKFQMHGVPCAFDLLTVDVDWNDYWLVKALDFGRFQPRVVAIEFSSYFRGSEKQVRSYKSDGVWGGGDRCLLGRIGRPHAGQRLQACCSGGWRTRHLGFGQGNESRRPCNEDSRGYLRGMAVSNAKKGFFCIRLRGGY